MFDYSKLTTIDREFIDIEYLQKISGFGYDRCAKIIRQVKNCSDTMAISGCVTRADWVIYLSRNLIEKEADYEAIVKKNKSVN